MLIRSVSFIKSATRPDGYPESGAPEIAFAGRSNVGKSSLINTLVNRKNLVRTSATPGRTQLLNFFSVNDNLTLVDLPGFGYAAVPLAVKRAWGPMVQTYLNSRDNLRAVLLLFDIRRTPREEELQLIEWLAAYRIPLIPVITKADKLPRGQRAASLKTIAAVTGLAPQEFILYSSLSKEGRETIWARISACLPGPESALETSA